MEFLYETIFFLTCSVAFVIILGAVFRYIIIKRELMKLDKPYLTKRNTYQRDCEGGENV